MTAPLALEDLVELERALQAALARGEKGELQILGYGEISCVVAWSSRGTRWACKRLPTFPNAASAERYAALFDEYLASLRAHGVQPIESALQRTEVEGGLAVWCVQPMLAPTSLLPEWLRTASTEDALAMIERVTRTIVGCVTPTLGLDAQASNWVLVDGDLRYLDVTTPMLRDPTGAERLELDLFLASLPWLMRPAVRRFMLRGILDKYYDGRGVVLDLLGNLLKEHLDPLLAPAVTRANTQLGTRPPIGEAEARRYYARDASDWSLLQRLRRLDRAWQRSVRRRTYPFLLPGRIER